MVMFLILTPSQRRLAAISDYFLGRVLLGTREKRYPRHLPLRRAKEGSQDAPLVLSHVRDEVTEAGAAAAVAMTVLTHRT